MKVVKSVGGELYGGNQPFQCLEKLEFREMPEWEEWQPSPSGGESPDFPRLQELILRECPKLIGDLPTHLPSLKTLDVYKCEVLHENRASNTLNTESLRGSLEKLTIMGCPGLSLLLESTDTLPSLQMLFIKFVGGKEWLAHNSNRLQSLSLDECSSLLSFPTNGLPTPLTSLHLVNCKKVEFLSREMMAKLTSLQSLLLFKSCDSLRSFPLGIFPNLSSLSIVGCQNLESLSVEGGADENLSHLNSLSIWGCRNLVSFPDGGLPTPNLTFFHVYNCENLKLLPDRMHTLTALQRLEISSLPNLVSFPEGGLPTPNLTFFSVGYCMNLKLLPDRMHTLTALQDLSISNLPNLVSFPEGGLPTPNLTFFSVRYCMNLKLLPDRMHTLTALQRLEIECLPHVVSFAQGGLPPNLGRLDIRNWDLVETLLNEQLLPATLHTLQIYDVSNLKSLDGKGFEHLASLQQLQISGCESLKFLPKEGLPASLSYLMIRGCPSLKKRYGNKKGKDWRNIARIPCIQIDHEITI
ncbi:putative disease resistance protein At3g14460 [Malus domestica]|uniref:putative disease resistance protein At3g14460 n=1 Tax=Malus domestica TaxID=3750 RepID=UPI003974D4C7